MFKFAQISASSTFLKFKKLMVVNRVKIPGISALI